MIKTEPYGVNLVRTYSDSGFKIVNQQGVMYGEAIDPANSGRTYTETNEPLDSYEDLSAEATETDYIEALQEAGVL
jgi:hypothetical protein